MLKAGSPSWPSDHNRGALREGQFAPRLVGKETWGATRRGWSPRLRTAPSRGSLELPRTHPELAGARRTTVSRVPCGGGRGRERPSQLGVRGRSRARQVEPAGGRARARAGPRPRPPARGQGVGAAPAGPARGRRPRRRDRAGAGPAAAERFRVLPPRAAPGALDRGRAAGKGGSGESPRAAPRPAAPPPRGRRAAARARAGATSPPGSRAPGHGFRQFPPHPAPVHLREEKVPRI